MVRIGNDQGNELLFDQCTPNMKENKWDGSKERLRRAGHNPRLVDVPVPYEGKTSQQTTHSGAATSCRRRRPTTMAAAMRLRTNDTHIMDTLGRGAVDGKYIIGLLRHGLLRHIGAAAVAAARRGSIGRGEAGGRSGSGSCGRLHPGSKQHTHNTQKGRNDGLTKKIQKERERVGGRKRCVRIGWLSCGRGARVVPH